jgi:cation-transporting ATPase E
VTADLSKEAGLTTEVLEAARGLDDAQVAERVKAGLNNAVPAASSRSIGAIIRANTFTRFNAILSALLVVILIVGPLQDALFGLVIIANTGIGIIQEIRAKRTLDALAVVGVARPKVRRGGRVVEIPSEELVKDDIILLGQGDSILVDGEVVEAEGLEVDESLLTGEADPLDKSAGDSLMSGSFVTAGTGAFRATKVGADAYAARLASQARRFTLVHSELRVGIDKFLKFMTWVMVPTAAALLASQLLLDNYGVAAALRGSVAGVVTMVPEGLVLLTSIAFAVGVIRLGQRRVLVQELPAIEGLARVDVVCLDKTGTLTDTTMTLHSVQELDGAFTDVPVEQVLASLAAADPQPNASLQVIADAYPTSPGWTVTGAAAFSSARKWSGASFDGQGTWLLGAPEVLLAPGSAELARADALADEGLRVLLLARSDRQLDGNHAAATEDARPAAFVVLEQRVRPDAADTLAYFAAQGVAIKVISGDHPRTVGAVARQLGIAGAEKPFDARELPEDIDKLAEVLETHTVFGRVNPQQKQAMVDALHSRGHVVAMTGDGVNDTLALKNADIGVAMGSGSGAARAVAQLVLLDNTFNVMPTVVAEGRRVLGNIERVANLFLTKTAYATFTALTAVAARVPYPFLPRHLTLVSSLTIGIPAFFLALGPNKQRARPGFVPRVLRFAVPCGAICAAASFGAYAVTRIDYPQAEAQSTAVIVLTLVAMWVLVLVARPLNWRRILLIGSMLAAFAGVLAIPWLRTFFALPLPGWDGMVEALGVGAVALVALEVAWRFTGWLHARSGSPTDN